MIAVLVPVLARPQNAQPLADSLYASTTAEIRLVWIVSPGDTDQLLACERAGGQVMMATWEPGHGDFARKINHAFYYTDEPFVFQAADDVEFMPGWDVEALKVAEATGAGVVGTNDDANPLVKRGRHATHSLIRRSYAEDPGASMDGPGTVFSTKYWHQCVDNELYDMAVGRGQWAFAAKSVVRHRHWIWRTAEKDATYAKGDLHHREDARLYLRRKRYFPRAGR